MKKLILLLLILFISGCEISNEDISGSSGDSYCYTSCTPLDYALDITSSTMGSGWYVVEYTLKQSSRSAVYNFACDLQLKSGDTILGTAFLSVAGLATIIPGAVYTEEANFFRVKTTPPPATIIYRSCSWLP